jgi:hypothetical protein
MTRPYSDEIQLLEPEQTSGSTVSKLLESVSLRQSPTNLAAALKAAIDLPTAVPAVRRAIIVLTDGHSGDELNTASLVEEAKRFGVRLYFIVTAGERTNRLSELKALAADTRGQFVTHDELQTFLKAPFELLDSGGRVYFPLGHFRQSSD